jgi:hypothetical protein
MLTKIVMHPDYERNFLWAGARNYLAMARFTFKRRGSAFYTWYLLMQWGYCMEELKEMDDAD